MYAFLGVLPSYIFEKSQENHSCLSPRLVRVQEVEKIVHEIGRQTPTSYSQMALLAERHLQHYESWALSQIYERHLLQVQGENLQRDAQPDERSKNAITIAHRYFQSVAANSKVF